MPYPDNFDRRAFDRAYPSGLSPYEEAELAAREARLERLINAARRCNAAIFECLGAGDPSPFDGRDLEDQIADLRGETAYQIALKAME